MLLLLDAMLETSSEKFANLKFVLKCRELPDNRRSNCILMGIDDGWMQFSKFKNALKSRGVQEQFE